MGEREAFLVDAGHDESEQELAADKDQVKRSCPLCRHGVLRVAMSLSALPRARKS
jgi:hypothetical protein